jgi:sterol desaturase/sphingolipid hydroxylase (fatty acid hydroxylase superfamily)
MADIIANLGYLDFFLWTVVNFLILYFTFTTGAYFLLVKNPRIQQYQKKAYRPGQIRTEIRRSMISILMFGLLSFFVCAGLRHGVYHLNYELSWTTVGLEALALFFWNEIHFYTIHRAYHLKRFYKYHADHHYSHVPSPFSAYSFHWSEGFLLGAVMPIAMLVHDFQYMSLLLLPVMSILMNVMGHSNLDLFPTKGIGSIWSFSKRHSLHHKIPHANFGFFLPYLDKVLGTAQHDDP